MFYNLNLPSSNMVWAISHSNEFLFIWALGIGKMAQWVVSSLGKDQGLS